MKIVTCTLHYVYIRCIYNAWINVTWQPMYGQRNNKARSRNHCCREKSISITYLCVCLRSREYVWVTGRVHARACLRVALIIQHATRKRHIVTSFVAPLAPTHFSISLNSTIFGKKLLNIKCVFWFSLQRLSKTFLILRRIQRDIVINVKTC